MFWCANDFHSGRGGFGLLAFPSFAAIPSLKPMALRLHPGVISPKSMARLVLALGVCAWGLVRERVLPPRGWRSKDTLWAVE